MSVPAPVPPPAPAPRTALVTGVSRRAGIGYAICRRLLADGLTVVGHGWARHDEDQSWGGDAIDEVVAELHDLGDFHHLEGDLARPDEPAEAVRRALDLVGPLDVLVANHARSARGTLAEVTAAELDACWAVNARATVLLVQAFAAQHRTDHPGRVLLFTSGQHLAPMADELAYAVSKGAVQQMALSLSDALIDRGITVNAVNPGPVDTGWASPELAARVGRALPTGRWTRPDQVADIVAWLIGPDAAPVTGQTIDTEGGFRRWVT
jgi:3-oxoacyl-[acyl-carrier protein] reductase